MKYKDLYSTSPDYCPELNHKLTLLHAGGFEMQNHAELFLDRIQGVESQKAYKSRLKCSAYVPYLSQITTHISASLFSEQLDVVPPGDATDTATGGDAPEDDFYKEFKENCDTNGTSFHQFMHEVFDRSLDELCVYVALDFPDAPKAESRAEETATKADKGYIYTIPYYNVIDYKVDPLTGQFIWLKLFEELFPDDNPLTINKIHQYQFRIWEVRDGRGCCTFYRTDVMPLKKPVTSSTDFKDVGTVFTSFPRIPIFLCRQKKAFHPGQQLGVMCQEYYQRNSLKVSNSNKTCVSLGVLKVGPEMDAPGDAISADIEIPTTSSQVRSKLENDGWIVVRTNEGWEEKVEIVEAKGDSFKFVSEDLKHLSETMHQIVKQMNMTAAANQKSLNRSAASKAVDQHGTSMLLSVYEHIVKDWARDIFTCLSEGRFDDIKWSAEGLSIAEVADDRSNTVDEIQKLGIDVSTFPDMWKTKYYYRLATGLIDNDLTNKEREELLDQFADSLAKVKGLPAAQDPTQTVSSPASGDPSQGDDPQPLGPQGSPLLPEGAHLQTGEHIDGNTVFEQLAQDYKEKDIEWVRHIPWIGPVEIPLSSIDFSNKDNWRASEEADKVAGFADKIANEGFSKPIILVNNPSNDNKMIIVDGHHRALAYQQNNQPAMAYVGQVGANTGPWMKLHSKQVGSKQASLSSNQKSTDEQH